MSRGHFSASPSPGRTSTEAALSVNRLGDVANRAREDQDSDEQMPIPEISGRVRCRDVEFGYAPGKHQLEHVSLDIPAGSLVAFVGLSGSGKSTLLKLIGRLYEPVKGSVEIDGFSLSKVELNSLRRQIGMVFQETLLLEGSVMDNIALSDPDAPSEAVIEAAKLAEAHDFIMTLPNGYASPVGEQGRNLSGGQRQRIALARLVMQNPFSYYSTRRPARSMPPRNSGSSPICAHASLARRSSLRPIVSRPSAWPIIFTIWKTASSRNTAPTRNSCPNAASTTRSPCSRTQRHERSKRIKPE